MPRPFAQVDVFTDVPYGGNPVAVVLDADGLDDEAMQTFARWTNLSETTFVLGPSEPGADYRVRIFTPVMELPFAGHPTLGTCHTWLEHGGSPASETIVQECAAGLIPIRRVEGRLAFAAPPLRRSGPADDETVAEVIDAFALDPARVLAAEWVDNGPPWIALLLDDPATVLGARPRFVDRDVGLAALYPPGSRFAVEVRAFFPKDGALVEDPVTGSLQAGLAQWLSASDRLPLPYVATQGAALRRTGVVHVSGADGELWIGGHTVTCIGGTVELDDLASDVS